MGRPLAFFEISSPDPARARHFYTTLFDWTTDSPAELGGYALVETGEPGTTGAGVHGGIGAADDGSGVPAGILVYFQVEDLAATLERAAELGGSALLPPTKLPGENGSVAVLADPDGNRVGLWA